MINCSIIIIDLSPFFRPFRKFLKGLCIIDSETYILNKNDVLAQNQYGFREKHSTFMAFMKMTDDISNEIDNKMFTV